jgi:hypothetical protein
MSVSIEARWIAAQIGERRFHVDVVPEWGDHANPDVRRVRERLMRQWYRGMLDFPEFRWVSVTDYGCGPQSLLLDIPGASDVTAMAVDPLRFTDDDETHYRRCRVQRYIGSAEHYDGPVTQEGCITASSTRSTGARRCRRRSGIRARCSAFLSGSGCRRTACICTHYTSQSYGLC